MTIILSLLLITRTPPLNQMKAKKILQTNRQIRILRIILISKVLQIHRLVIMMIKKKVKSLNLQIRNQTSRTSNLRRLPTTTKTLQINISRTTTIIKLMRPLNQETRKQMIKTPNLQIMITKTLQVNRISNNKNQLILLLITRINQLITRLPKIKMIKRIQITIKKPPPIIKQIL